MNSVLFMGEIGVFPKTPYFSGRIYCPGFVYIPVFYHKSIDASDIVHNVEYILSLMREVVDETREQYIVA
ncbi:hypothetical protein Taro_051481 [Colocasia esculenta]|uniref:Uncharacterized protein n=1 Tax=Colocasia esculenta TaxID=4460 RepID=A0A843XG67_COLES|nr:hypothetical protein [Colocasia esculenta]